MIYSYFYLSSVFWKFLKSYFFLGLQDKPESPADGMNVEEEKRFLS
jgi:hypothetical protein